MSWDGYISNLTASQWVEDAVIVGHEPGQESVWAGKQDGWLRGITPAEIKTLMTDKRDTLFCTGVTIAGRKCTVLRDFLNTDGQHTMDLKMKTTDTETVPFQFTVGKSLKALIIVRGVKDAPGGKVNPPVFDMISYLRKANL